MPLLQEKSPEDDNRQPAGNRVASRPACRPVPEHETAQHFGFFNAGFFRFGDKLISETRDDGLDLTTTTFVYDPVGNRLVLRAEGASPGIDLTTYTYDSANRMETSEQQFPDSEKLRDPGRFREGRS